MKNFKTRHKKKQKNGGDMIEIGDDQKKRMTDRNSLKNNRNQKTELWIVGVIGGGQIRNAISTKIIFNQESLHMKEIVTDTLGKENHSNRPEYIWLCRKNYREAI